MIRQLRLPLLLGAAALAFCGARPSAAQDQDTLFLVGSTESGKVLEETFGGVSFQPEKGAKKLVPWDTVQDVGYFDAPDDLQGGLATLGAGNYEVAAEQLQAALGTEDVRPMIVQKALFHLAYAEQRMGNDKDAIANYTKLLKDFPKGRYLRLGAENLVALHLAQNDAAGAQAVLSELATGAKGVEGIEPVLALLDARLLEGQGKAAEAGQRYTAVESTAGASPTLVQEGKLGRARMLLRGNKGAEAEPLFQGLIKESAAPRVQSGAWNGLGEVWSVDGRAKKNSDRILEALYAYLRTVVQYKPLPGESTEEYERALAGAAKCFQYLSELEQNNDKKKQHRDRERERLEQLQREFPNSTFLPKK
jgi:predicted Zn-dependent protease